VSSPSVSSASTLRIARRHRLATLETLAGASSQPRDLALARRRAVRAAGFGASNRSLTLPSTPPMPGTTKSPAYCHARL